METPMKLKEQSPWKKHKIALLMLLPALVAVFVFSYLPLLGRRGRRSYIRDAIPYYCS